jgi:hypothetical protein
MSTKKLTPRMGRRTEPRESRRKERVWTELRAIVTALKQLHANAIAGGASRTFVCQQIASTRRQLVYEGFDELVKELDELPDLLQER